MERAADALYGPRDDELLGVHGDAAPDGGQGEDHHAQSVDTPAPVAVSQRTAYQDQGGQEQRVGLDDPLRVQGGGAKTRLYLREGHVRHGTVYKGHRGTDDGGRQGAGARARGA